ncbi:MAG: dihydrolipoyl dehydrogenase [Pseudomonadota bacterium]
MSVREVDVAIIGSGSAGLYALSKVRPSGKRFVLINGGELGTTCARVGCMPSKAVIQVAEDFHRRGVFNRFGIEGHEDLGLDVRSAMEYVQDLRDTFVDRVLSNSTDKLGDEFVEGYARFLEPGLLDVEGQQIRAERIIIATGSRPLVPEAWRAFSDPVLTSDSFFEQEDLPASIAVIGLGVVGLELGQSLHRMGVEVTGIDVADTIGGISDPEVAKVAVDVLGKEFPLWLGAAAEVTEASDGRLRVSAGDRSVVVEKVLVAIGRVPNLDKLNLGAAGVEIPGDGVPEYDPHTMQVGDLPIFFAGDVTGERPLLHEAGDEGRIAGHNAVAEEVTRFRRKVPVGITFCDPNICFVGKHYSELDPETTAIGQIQLGPVGRALIMAKNKGLIRVYAEKSSGRLLGAEMATPKGENLAHLLAWCIEQDLGVGELLRMPFYHPVIEEALQAALYDLYGKVDTRNTGPITELEALAG